MELQKLWRLAMNSALDTAQLDYQELEQATGGIAPLVFLGSLVTSKGFTAFATAVTLVGLAAEIGTAIISDE